MWFPSHYLQHLRFPRLILRLPVCSRTHYLQYLRFPRHTGRGSSPIIYSTCGSRALSRACPCVLASIIYNTCGSSATRDVVPVDNFMKRSTIAMVAKGARAPRQLKTRRVRAKTSKFHPNPPLDPRGANFNHPSCPTESDRHGLLVKVGPCTPQVRQSLWLFRKDAMRIGLTSLCVNLRARMDFRFTLLLNKGMERRKTVHLVEHVAL